jgi:hypothetical protein
MSRALISVSKLVDVVARIKPLLPERLNIHMGEREDEAGARGDRNGGVYREIPGSIEADEAVDCDVLVATGAGAHGRRL